MRLEEACKIVKKNMPDYSIISGVEFTDLIAFNIIPNDTKGKGFANSCTYVVYKNGRKPEYVNMFEISKRMHNPKDIIQMFDEIN